MAQPSEWIELQDGYITDQPLMYVGRTSGMRRVPNPAIEPTKAWLIIKRCRQAKRAVIRRSDVIELSGSGKDDLERQVAEFAMRSDVRLQDQPPEERT